MSLVLAGIGLRFALPGWIYGLLGALCDLHTYWSARRLRASSSV